MARKELTLSLDSTYARDASKTFHLTEMPATQAEKFAIRALLALTRAGIEVPDNVTAMGMGAIAAIGLRAFGNLSFDEASPLLDEMMNCVQIVPDPRNPLVKRPVDVEDVEEVRTLLFLRNEVVALHTGFSIAGELSSFRANQTDQSQQQPLTSPDQ
jgi:hypothetical protein